MGAIISNREASATSVRMSPKNKGDAVERIRQGKQASQDEITSAVIETKPEIMLRQEQRQRHIFVVRSRTRDGTMARIGATWFEEKKLEEGNHTGAFENTGEVQ